MVLDHIFIEMTHIATKVLLRTAIFSQPSSILNVLQHVQDGPLGQKMTHWESRTKVSRRPKLVSSIRTRNPNPFIGLGMIAALLDCICKCSWLVMMKSDIS